jgi:uncharacterized membrane protein YdjX (TVP38/TMEM64 family)
MRKRLKIILELVIIGIIFIIFSYLTSQNKEFIANYINYRFYGIIVYIFLVALSIILAPVTVIPLTPIASQIWGWQIAGLLTLIGWTLGAVIAFLLARKYKERLLSKIKWLRKLEKHQNKIPSKNYFFGILFIRMFLVVDGLSYLLGLFSNVRFSTYLIATFLGLIPLSFAIVYLGTIPTIYQIIGLVISLIIIFLFFKFSSQNN